MSHFVLDVNETLSDMSPVEDALVAHGAPAGLGATWFAGVLRDGFALSLHGAAPAFPDLGRAGMRDLLAANADSLDAPVDAVVDDVLGRLAILDVHPDVAPGIRAAIDAGHTVSAFTNGSAKPARGLLERAGVLDLVHAVISVEELSVWKPHPDSYASAARRLDASPSELTMVAVHPWDLDGASRAGLDTVWVDRSGNRVWPEAFVPPGRRVEGLTELV